MILDRDEDTERELILMDFVSKMFLDNYSLRGGSLVFIVCLFLKLHTWVAYPKKIEMKVENEI